MSRHRSLALKTFADEIPSKGESMTSDLGMDINIDIDSAYNILEGTESTFVQFFFNGFGSALVLLAGFYLLVTAGPSMLHGTRTVVRQISDGMADVSLMDAMDADANETLNILYNRSDDEAME